MIFHFGRMRKEYIIETELSYGDVLSRLNATISDQLQVQSDSVYWLRGKLIEDTFDVKFEPNQLYRLRGKVINYQDKTEIRIVFYDGDEFVIALSSVMSFWSALSYVRFRSMFCFIAAIIVWLICYYGFSYKKENCINWIRELVEGHIR